MRCFLSALIALPLLLKSAAAAPDAPPEDVPRTPMPLSEYTVQRTRGSIKIDGILDEESWKRALPTPEWKFLDGLTPAKFATTAKVLWDDECLYLAFSIADDDVRATRKERDDDIYNEDCVELFIMDQLRRRRQTFLEYEINALNTQFDSYNLGPLDGIVNWDSKGWRSAVKVDGTLNNSQDIDKGWTVEMAIPFFDLYATVFRTPEHAKQQFQRRQLRPRAGARWRANLYRIRRFEDHGEWMAWSPTLSSGFHVPERFGTLIFSDDKAGTAKS